jgi:oxygen-independent coproporphyrinogen-3 oxidase
MDATVGVYVHVPFCERVCPYCDFAVTAARPLRAALEERYVEALLRELDAQRGAYAGRRLESVYLGGGTPSLLQPESIARIIGAVRDAFPDAAPIETTLEVNPSTVERERLPGFRAAGVDRVSVGVQSFDDTILQRLGRAHRADEARRTLAACRAAGFGALSLDLIFAAPGQRLAGFLHDLEEAVGFGPDHVSTYELTIEPGTPFATADARRQLDRPDEEESVAMLEAAEKRLGAAGFSRYELSSYARPGFVSVHNRRYWQRRPVLGLGVGAFSSDPPREGAPHGQRRSNVRDVATYLERLEAGETPEAAPPEVFSAATARGEAVFLALRAAPGVDAAGFEREFGGPPRAFYGATLDALSDEGLIREGPGGDFCLTERGRLLSDSVFARFV